MEASFLLLLRRVKSDLELRLDLFREAVNRLLYFSHRANAGGPEESRARERCVEWLEEYIAQPHPKLGKDGEICPFVRPALQQDEISFLVYSQITSPTVSEVRMILELEGIERIGRTVPETRGTNLTTALVMFPRLDIKHVDVIEKAYLECCEKLNGRGVMLGAFFPGSVQPGHHNADFHVYQAPFPIYVLRPMGVHDIQFIWSTEAFREYHRRYAARYDAGDIADSSGLPEKYRRAFQEFG